MDVFKNAYLSVFPIHQAQHVVFIFMVVQLHTSHLFSIQEERGDMVEGFARSIVLIRRLPSYITLARTGSHGHP